MRVILELWSNRPHLQQLLTGLVRLNYLGEIRLEQRFAAKPESRYLEKGAHLEDATMAHCRLHLEDGRKLYFDFHDGDEVCLNALEWADVYFKRGYLTGAYDSAKVRAFGLNYLVYEDRLDPFLFRRQMRFDRRDWKRHILGRCGMDRIFQNRYILPRLYQSEQAPAPGAYTSVLFQTRLWDPAEAPSGEKADEWERLNLFRIKAVRALKEAYPEVFFGGIAPSDFARKQCPPEVLCAQQASTKVGYYKLLQKPSIAISTEGLHRSNGWKLAEYIAFSKPVVSEPPVHLIPHGFSEGSNYLAFSSVDELLSQVERLLDDPILADRISMNNRSYYQSHLHPEVLVRNLLKL